MTRSYVHCLVKCVCMCINCITSEPVGYYYMLRSGKKNYKLNSVTEQCYPPYVIWLLTKLASGTHGLWYVVSIPHPGGYYFNILLPSHVPVLEQSNCGRSNVVIYCMPFCPTTTTLSRITCSLIQKRILNCIWWLFPSALPSLLLSRVCLPACLTPCFSYLPQGVRCNGGTHRMMQD